MSTESTPSNNQSQTPDPSQHSNTGPQTQNPQDGAQPTARELELEKKLADLQKDYDALAKQPGSTTSSEILNQNPEQKKVQAPANKYEQFLKTSKEAADLYNSLP